MSHIEISIPPHVAVYYQEYNIIDIDTMNEKMRDHKGKIISDSVLRRLNSRRQKHKKTQSKTNFKT